MPLALLAVPLAAALAASFDSVWLVLVPHLVFFLAATTPAHARLLAGLSGDDGWGGLPEPDGRLWTDDYSDLLGSFRS